ncbi:MarR family winged helix-turn-helix transcriptional regulator [Streptomyces sp. NPDC091376]|uniref:MarR family winged helix-turn-helix transcriptional regulator n=1 Tax=Streptomyces sp. NPDC091376 TaxID=3365994 RepID=UPI0037F664F4
MSERPDRPTNDPTNDPTPGPTPGFLVWRLSMKWRGAVDRALAPLGVTHAQYSLLGSLYDVHRAGLRPSQRQLADHTGLEALYVSKLARALAAAGLIERAEDPTDTRAVQLSLTEEGREVAERAIAVVRQVMDGMLAPLGGLEGPGTQAFARQLTALLEAPLDVSVDVPPADVSLGASLTRRPAKKTKTEE